MPAISVVLPVYNGSNYLRECIVSVLKQTHQDFEFLIGDDFSIDESSSVINAHQDSRIRYYQREKNIGLFANLNKLILDSSAGLIHILCQDDVLEPRCLEAEIEFFHAHPEIGMSFCKAHIIDKHGTEIEKAVLGDLPASITPALSMQLFYYYGCIPGSLSSVCVRKKSFTACGLFNELFTVSGDYEMWVRICQTFNLGVIQQHLVRLRSHQAQLSRLDTSGIECIEQNHAIRSNILSQLPVPLRTHARSYARMKLNVFEMHYCLKCFFQGRLNDCLQIIKTIGAFDSCIAGIVWFFSLNNRLFGYRAKIVTHTENDGN